jgi:hypothetical protein
MAIGGHVHGVASRITCGVRTTATLAEVLTDLDSHLPDLYRLQCFAVGSRCSAVRRGGI